MFRAAPGLFSFSALILSLMKAGLSCTFFEVAVAAYQRHHLYLLPIAALLRAHYLTTLRGILQVWKNKNVHKHWRQIWILCDGQRSKVKIHDITYLSYSYRNKISGMFKGNSFKSDRNIYFAPRMNILWISWLICQLDWTGPDRKTG